MTKQIKLISEVQAIGTEIYGAIRIGPFASFGEARRWATAACKEISNSLRKAEAKAQKEAKAAAKKSATKKETKDEKHQGHEPRRNRSSSGRNRRSGN